MNVYFLTLKSAYSKHQEGENTELKGEEAFPPHNKKRMSSQNGLFKAIIRISHLPFHRAGLWENISVRSVSGTIRLCSGSNRPLFGNSEGDTGPWECMCMEIWPGQAHGSACQWRTGIWPFLGIQSELFCFTCRLLLTVRLGPFPSSLNSNGTSQSHEPPYLK